MRYEVYQLTFLSPSPLQKSRCLASAPDGKHWCKLVMISAKEGYRGRVGAVVLPWIGVLWFVLRFVR